MARRSDFYVPWNCRSQVPRSSRSGYSPEGEITDTAEDKWKRTFRGDAAEPYRIYTERAGFVKRGKYVREQFS